MNKYPEESGKWLSETVKRDIIEHIRQLQNSTEDSTKE
jgi:hypothetical protein